SLRLRVGLGTQERKQTSNKLECHSSLFESIRVSGSRTVSSIWMNSNLLEYARITSNGGGKPPMDEMLRQALDQVSEKSLSKLEPHADIIRELRWKGRTYDVIAQFFAERMNLKSCAKHDSRVCSCARTTPSAASC